jgi:hypothetical protein
VCALFFASIFLLASRLCAEFGKHMTRNQGARQLRLFSAEEEAELYHRTEQGGYFSLLVQTSAETQKRQSSYPLVEMPQVLANLDLCHDTWLSQAEFTKPNRRVVNLLRLGLLFVDLDTYRFPWAVGKSAEDQAAAVIYHCQQEGIPEPSLIVFSGRGLQAKWLLDLAISRYALPRWNACQRSLVDKLSSLGADPAARDASRVLRLVNTTNLKSGEVCRVVWVKEENGLPIRYNFEYLAEALLPIARWEIEQQRQVKKVRKSFNVLPGGKEGALRGFSGRQLAWHRLEDLRALATLRGGVSEGERMKHLFWRLNFLLLSGATHSSQMYSEAGALAQELDKGWSHNSKELMTLFSKAKAYEAGEKIDFAGKEYTPLYTPKNDTLINLFCITEEEQKQLKTLISKEIANERHKKREQLRRAAIKEDEERFAQELEKQQQRERNRRAAIKKDEERLAQELKKDRLRKKNDRKAKGAIDRESYEAKALSRLKPWHALGISRASWYRLGKPSTENETSPSMRAYY